VGNRPESGCSISAETQIRVLGDPNWDLYTNGADTFAFRSLGAPPSIIHLNIIIPSTLPAIRSLILRLVLACPGIACAAAVASPPPFWSCARSTDETAHPDAARANKEQEIQAAVVKRIETTK
jgi:hypothetical protein